MHSQLSGVSSHCDRLGVTLLRVLAKFFSTADDKKINGLLLLRAKYPPNFIKTLRGEGLNIPKSYKRPQRNISFEKTPISKVLKLVNCAELMKPVIVIHYTQREKGKNRKRKAGK